MNKAKLTFLGTGTSLGVPIIGCHCEVCRSADPKDRRLRSSALVEWMGLTILIDAGPDFREQLLRSGVSHLDAILLTHNHRDHTGGLDDTRSLNYVDKRASEIYCESSVLTDLEEQYSYAFADPKYPGVPVWRIHVIDEHPFIVPPDSGRELTWVHDTGYAYKMPDSSLKVCGNEITKAAVATKEEGGAVVIPIRGYHDKMPVLGFRFGNIAYITDVSKIPEEELEKLQGLDHVTLNTVGYKSHHSHLSLDEALEMADRIGAKHTWLTHLSHFLPIHKQFTKDLKRLCAERKIRSEVLPAYDGLTIC